METTAQSHADLSDGLPKAYFKMRLNSIDILPIS